MLSRRRCSWTPRRSPTWPRPCSGWRAGSTSASPRFAPRAGAHRSSSCTTTMGAGVYTHALARCLDPDRPFYAVHLHGLDGPALPTTVKAIAANRLQAVRDARPHGPYVLGGHCNGGLIALEMARQLRAEGERVEAVVMIDTRAPALGRRALHGASDVARPAARPAAGCPRRALPARRSRLGRNGRVDPLLSEPARDPEAGRHAGPDGFPGAQAGRYGPALRSGAREPPEVARRSGQPLTHPRSPSLGRHSGAPSGATCRRGMRAWSPCSGRSSFRRIGRISAGGSSSRASRLA